MSFLRETELMYQALHAEVGIIVATDNVELLRQRFYTARAKDPLLSKISILTSPTNPNGEVWLAKNSEHKDDAEES